MNLNWWMEKWMNSSSLDREIRNLYLVLQQYILLICVSCDFVQFFKNLSKTLKDVVWKSEDLQMQPAA
jgi:hypothetical protein